ncbi:MAG: N-acylglucosamine 2-epimerase [Candidatus Latescibacteria bacterium]|nr:N-acylglucosamine 2-epimerase [Candidatus Latescibacterota bacterium]
MSAFVFGLVLGPVEGQQKPVELAGIEERLERLLLENILPFWYPQMLDREYGGYRLNHDAAGHWQGPADKALVTQARTLWFFARLYNDGYGGPEHLQAARHGFQFLRDKLWDDEYGGFYWAVDHRGETATRPHKHLYGQGFGLYALAEYIEATGDTAAVRLASELFGLLESRAHDSEWGGYREFFGRDWGAPPADVGPYVGGVKAAKLMNTHLHLMEPFTTYLQVSGNELVRRRLVELILVQSNAVVRKEVGACTDKYAADWTPLTGPQFERVSYGHDIENVWLLVEACRAAGLPNGPLLDLYRTLMDYSLQYGYDHEQGGFYGDGNFGAPADVRSKTWWVQAEGLVAALYMYELTGEQRYWTVFEQTLQWIETRQADWAVGDWHSVVNQDGSTGYGKAGAWKSPYHNGRAVLQCLEVLGGLQGE